MKRLKILVLSKADIEELFCGLMGSKIPKNYPVGAKIMRMFLQNDSPAMYGSEQELNIVVEHESFQEVPKGHTIWRERLEWIDKR